MNIKKRPETKNQEPVLVETAPGVGVSGWEGQAASGVGEGRSGQKRGQWGNNK